MIRWAFWNGWDSFPLQPTFLSFCTFSNLISKGHKFSGLAWLDVNIENPEQEALKKPGSIHRSGRIFNHLPLVPFTRAVDRFNWVFLKGRGKKQITSDIEKALVLPVSEISQAIKYTCLSQLFVRYTF